MSISILKPDEIVIPLIANKKKFEDWKAQGGPASFYLAGIEFCPQHKFGLVIVTTEMQLKIMPEQFVDCSTSSLQNLIATYLSEPFDPRKN